MGEIKKIKVEGKTFSYLETSDSGDSQTSTAYYAKINLSDEVLLVLKNRRFSYGVLGLDYLEKELEPLPEGCTLIIVLHYSTSPSRMNFKLLYMNNSNEILKIITVSDIQQGYSLQREFNQIDLIDKGNCLDLISNPVISEKLTDYYSITDTNNIYNLKVEGQYLQPNTSLKVTNISNALNEFKDTIKSNELFIIETLGVSEIHVKLYNRIHTEYLVGEFTFLDRLGETVENWQVQFIRDTENLTQFDIDNIHTFKEEYIQNSFNQYEKDYLEQIEVHKGVRDNYYKRLYNRHMEERDLIRKEEREYLTKPISIFMNLTFLEFLFEHGHVSITKS